MNTRLEYLYRDASNYKRFGAVMFSGAADDYQRARLIKALHDEQWFITSQVRLPELFFTNLPLNADDHCWHELEALTVTDEAANDEHHRTIEEFIREVENAKKSGWREFDVREKARS